MSDTAQGEFATSDPPAVDEITLQPRPRAGRRVLAPIDLITPAAVIVVLTALYAYVYSRDLGTTSDNILDPPGLVEDTVNHVVLAFTIALLVIVIAVPLGVMITRPRTQVLAPVVLAVANVGQAAPSLGLLALVGIYAIGFWPAVLILTAYAALSVLRNTVAGLDGRRPRRPRRGARAWACRRWPVLLRVELPLAVPVIAAGARTALILAVATVPLGQALNAGGLGQALFELDQDQPTPDHGHDRDHHRGARPHPRLGGGRGAAGRDPAGHPMTSNSASTRSTRKNEGCTR